MKIEPSVSTMLRALALFVLDKWCPHCLCGLLRRVPTVRCSALLSVLLLIEPRSVRIGVALDSGHEAHTGA